MTLTTDPAVLRAALTSLISAAGDTPAGVEFCRKLLRFGLSEIDQLGARSAALEGAASGMQHLADAMVRVAEHAEFVAEQLTT